MSEREHAALDGYQLIPRVLHDIEVADTSAYLLGRRLAAPLVERVKARVGGEDGLIAVDADDLLAKQTGGEGVVAVISPRRMAELVPTVRDLVALSPAAIALDFAPLADSPPFGTVEWRPRTREDIAEIRAAAGGPLWLFGIASAADAAVAAEAGVDAIVVGSQAGRRLGAPACIDSLTEIIDAVAGMLTIACAGPVRDGMDVLRYLAVGAEAVVVSDGRPLATLAAELEYAMRLTGCASLADVSYDILFSPLFEEP